MLLKTISVSISYKWFSPSFLKSKA